jgi:hypothetical protein
MLPSVLREYRTLKTQIRERSLDCDLRFASLFLEDKRSASGTASGHYFHQDILVARKILKAHPVRHVDVGSRIDGFVAHVATFRPIEVLDIRPLRTTTSNISFMQCDIMDPNLQLSNYCDSLSCLHVLEHFGLGRYGDRLDIEGHLHGIENLHKILQPNGTLYLSVPIGADRVDFNGERVFSIKSMLEIVRHYSQLVEFSYVDDAGDLHEAVALDSERVANNCGCSYGCGIFELKKGQ